MIRMSCLCSHGPTRPCAPNSRTKTIPEMTGDTLNGRSMSVTRRFLPRNSKRAIAQEAARPNRTLSGTATPVTISVSRIAASAIGSVTAVR